MKESAYQQTLITRKRYSTPYNTSSLAEVKHTRSSYSSRDDRQAFSLSIAYSRNFKNAAGNDKFQKDFTYWVIACTKYVKKVQGEQF